MTATEWPIWPPFQILVQQIIILIFFVCKIAMLKLFYILTSPS